MILIRADANENIGTGHVMRCLSVATALREASEEVVFVTADHRGDHLIDRNGFESICLESDWMHMDEEIPVLRELLEAKEPLLLLVDSYYVTEDYFKALSPLVKIAYFDDMNTSVWDVDYLIDYNVFAKVLDYSWYSDKNTELLIGPEYAPLRKEFRKIERHPMKDKVTDVLVSAGGADPERMTERIVREVCPYRSDIEFHFVIGALNPRIEEIKELAGKNVILHINERHMSELMKQCDIAISAAGTTLYELCACGIPTITYILADNQIIAAEQFAVQRIMLNAGDCRGNNNFTIGLNRCIEDLSLNKEKRCELSVIMQQLVDGKGSDRIAKALLQG